MRALVKSFRICFRAFGYGYRKPTRNFKQEPPAKTTTRMLSATDVIYLPLNGFHERVPRCPTQNMATALVAHA